MATPTAGRRARASASRGRGATAATRPAGGRRASDDDGGLRALLKAVYNRDLKLLKAIVKSIDDPSVVLSLTEKGFGVLGSAACMGNLEICKYMVEEHGADVNTPGLRGMTAVMAGAESDDVPTVKYLLDHGGDLMKTDDEGRTALHHAVGAGCCKVTKFLLSKGVPVDIDCGHGTPLLTAIKNEKDKTLKILLDHHANPNTSVHGVGTPLMVALCNRSMKCMDLLIKAGADINDKGFFLPPLLHATFEGGFTNFVQFLLKAGADPNIPDDLGRLPIELAALRDCREEVEILFPLTSPIPNVPQWSVDGVISHTKIQDAKPMDHQGMKKWRYFFKSKADNLFRQEKYEIASQIYELATHYPPVDATIYANRSLCKLLLGDGEGALSDAITCRTMRPKWAKACYRQGTAHMLLKEYKQARDALLDAQKLDPGNVEIERELSKATELMKKPSKRK